MTLKYTMVAEGRYPGEFLIQDLGDISYDQVTIAPSQDLKSGEVVSRISATNEICAFNPAGDNGSEIPVGVLWAEATTAAGETARARIAARLCTVHGEYLAFADGVDPVEMALAVEALAERHIVVR